MDYNLMKNMVLLLPFFVGFTFQDLSALLFCAGVYCIDRRYSYHLEPRYRGTVWGGLSPCDLIHLWLPSQSSCSYSSLSQRLPPLHFEPLRRSSLRWKSEKETLLWLWDSPDCSSSSLTQSGSVWPSTAGVRVCRWTVDQSVRHTELWRKPRL